MTYIAASGDGAEGSEENDAEKAVEKEGGEDEDDEQSLLGKRKTPDATSMRSSETLQEEIDIDDE